MNQLCSFSIKTLRKGPVVFCCLFSSFGSLIYHLLYNFKELINFMITNNVFRDQPLYMFGFCR